MAKSLGAPGAARQWRRGAIEAVVRSPSATKDHPDTGWTGAG